MSAGRTRTKIAAVAIAGSLALLPMETSQAHRFRAGGSTSIKYRRPAFKGRIRSPRKFCRRNRFVTVNRVRRGRDRRIGQDFSNRRGRWRVVKRNPRDGRYYARVAGKRRKRHRHSHRCRPFRSRIIRIRNGRQVRR